MAYHSVWPGLPRSLSDRAFYLCAGSEANAGLMARLSSDAGQGTVRAWSVHWESDVIPLPFRHQRQEPETAACASRPPSQPENCGKLQPFTKATLAVEADLNGEGKPRLSACSHEAEAWIKEVVIVVSALADGGIQLEVSSITLFDAPVATVRDGAGGRSAFPLPSMLGIDRKGNTRAVVRGNVAVRWSGLGCDLVSAVRMNDGSFSLQFPENVAECLCSHTAFLTESPGGERGDREHSHVARRRLTMGRCVRLYR